MAKAPDHADTNKKVETFAETAPKNIPHVEEHIEPGGVVGPDIEDYKGKFKRKSDHQEYAVAYKPDPINLRDYRAQNTLHFWQGSRDQFRRDFTLANGDEITDKNDPGTDSKGEAKPDPDLK